jgi:hypothetical protein
MRVAASLTVEETLPHEPYFQLVFELNFNGPMRDQCPFIR